MSATLDGFMMVTVHECMDLGFCNGSRCLLG